MRTLIPCALALLLSAAPPARVRPIQTHTLPRLNGAALKATMIEVNYGPGESSPIHTHPCPVLGYVVEGAVRMQVDGGPETVYHRGEGFYEPPNAVHGISANASRTEPATFLATFVCDHDAPLSSDVPGGRR